MKDPKGPAKGPKEATNIDMENRNNNSFIPSEEIREILSQDHTLQSIQELQDNWDRIPRAFKKEVIDYLSDALKEYGKTSSYGKKIENFLTSVLPSGSEILRKINPAIHPKNNAKKDDKEKQKNLYKTRFAYDGFHYCEFSDNGVLRFLKYRDGNSEVISSVEIPDPDDENSAITILPAPQIAQTKRDRALQEDRNDAVKFPPAPISYDSEYALYCELKAFIHQFMELKPEDEIIISLYIMKAAIFDALKDTSFPFIHILAPYGKGKSRLLTVTCEITPYGFYSVDIKSAALKRVSDLYGAPLFVDEKGQMDNELAAILNGKYNANALVLNANNDIQQGYTAIIGYRIFGPLVLAGRTPFRDDAIESKSFQINMDFELTRDDVPRKIKGDLLDRFNENARNIRGKLLQFRIKWHDRINEIKGSEFLKPYEKHTEPRLFEVISFFEDLLEIIPEIKPEIGEVLKAQILRNAQVAAETPNGIIANEVLALMDSPEATEEYSIGGKTYTGIYLSAIYDELGKDYAKQTGKILSALGLKIDRPRITKTRKGLNGEPQEYTKQYRMVRIPEEKKINELKSRYDPEFVIANLSSIEQGLQTKPFQEFHEFQDIGNPPTKNNNEDNDKKTDAPLQNDGTLGTHGTELKEEPANSAIQSERKLWTLNPKLELFNLVEKFAPKSKYYSLTAKAIHDMIAMYGIDLSTIHDLCEQLHKEGAFQKTDAGGYYISKEFLEGGDYK